MVSFLFSLYFIYHIVCKILKKYKSFSGHPPLPPRQSLNTPHPPHTKAGQKNPSCTKAEHWGEVKRASPPETEDK